ncbi:potassium-transporting ATPase KdpC subunit [Reticulibacter mediterranei]|uniref:Potassium-transporting ATPase KdpC subunit n=1 Tax=Reticulibacter mediterranei TaxID=2778369 RepID=A0A8J3IR52_9CHLR|nr:potassium-transporting ATPase subunit KdpC [Reticulibacter mediterranei]GHO95412.1 potassium-transporting ATPase KdpC subunit [Reticulibacter mediterranei]
MSVTQLPPTQADEPTPSPRRNLVMKYVRPAIMMTLLLTIITGLIYPGIVTVLAQVIFPYQANGSLHTVNGKIIGSDLIGQQWTSPKYFHGRPSVTVNPATGTPEPYAADNSTASNIGPTNKQLIDGNGGAYKGVKNYADQFRKENGLAPNTPLPSDIVTASGSGLDPDISPEAAFLQVARVAKARGMSEATVHKLVEDHIQGRFLWIFGEPHVNVLDLNLALDGTK